MQIIHAQKLCDMRQGYLLLQYTNTKLAKRDPSCLCTHNRTNLSRLEKSRREESSRRGGRICHPYEPGGVFHPHTTQLLLPDLYATATDTAIYSYDFCRRIAVESVLGCSLLSIILWQWLLRLNSLLSSFCR